MSDNQQETPSDGNAESGTKSGFIAVLGAPNAGKSTFINRVVGTKVSIVSPKVQTTRTRVLGIMIHDNAQLIFIDTPGIFEPRRRLDRAMVAAAWSGAADADLVVLLIDCKRGFDDDTRRIVKNLNEQNRQVALALNKVDLVKKPDLLALAAALNEAGSFTGTYMISALKGDGVDDLINDLATALPPGPWMFPPDQVSDMPARLLAAEITREQLYLQLRQELPYSATVETESWEERPDGSVAINQVIYVERDSQKGIVLGKGGARIKSIGATARAELEDILEQKVHVMLFVKVRERWSDDPERYRDWGLDFSA